MDTAVRLATVCAFLLVAQQVAAKAVRDTLFLTQFDVTLLPRMIVTASVASILAVLGSSRALTRFGPHRMLPPALITSAALQLLLVLVQPYAPGLVAFLLYLHVCIFGAVLISWFWSMLNEGLDPSTARRRVGRIAGGGTFGGLVGGLLAERIAATWTTSALLPALAALHGVAAWLAWRTSRSLDVRLPAPSAPAPNRSGLRVLAEVPYLRQLGWLVGVGTVAATLLDYVFKARAAAALTDTGLLRCFALFYTATSLGSFVLQSALTRRLLERGIATTAASLPAVVAAGGSIALAFPTFLVTAVVRGLEAAVRSSLFRSSYELFYTPVRREDKRAAKTIVDVGVDRAGDALGGGVIQGVLLLTAATGLGTSPTGATTIILLALAVALGLTGLLIARRLDRGYTGALEESLLDHGRPSGAPTAAALESHSMFFPTLTQLDSCAIAPELEDALESIAPDDAPAPIDDDEAPRPVDPRRQLLEDLRSRRPERVKAALAALESPPADLIPILVQLLPWDAVASDVVETLRRVPDDDAGPLVFAMLDAGQDFATRRRLARVFATSSSPHAAAGLLAALGDARFEVRFRAGVALARMHERAPDAPLDPRDVFAAIERESRVNRHVWESNRLLDEIEPNESPFYDEILRSRSSRSLEHVFNLLSLVVPSPALRVAYRGLHAEDPKLRGTALEYLEQILPPAVRERLWPFLDDDRAARGATHGLDDLMESLLRSHESIQVELERLRRRDTPPEPAD